jgi:hypothetical protein
MSNGAITNGAAPTTLTVVPPAASDNGQASPDKPWHQLDADMCLVPQQWQLPTCSATFSGMLISNRAPATLPVLTRDEASSMTPVELRSHLSVLMEQVQLLQSVNLARKVGNSPTRSHPCGVVRQLSVAVRGAGGQALTLSGSLCCERPRAWALTMIIHHYC